MTVSGRKQSGTEVAEISAAEFSGSDFATHPHPKRPKSARVLLSRHRREGAAGPKHTWAGIAGPKKVSEMPRHGLEIVRHENAILRGRQREHLGVGHSFQVRVVCGEEIHLRFPA